MKIFLLLLATSITLAYANKTFSATSSAQSDCPIGVWGCGKQKHLLASQRRFTRRSRVGATVRVGVDTDDGATEGCDFGEWGCRKRTTVENVDTVEKKRQMDCPFGVWGCKRRVGDARREKSSGEPCLQGTRGCRGRRHARTVDDLIEELFTESRQ